MSAKCHFIIKAWPSLSNWFTWLFSSQHGTIQYIWHIRHTVSDIHLSRGGRLQKILDFLSDISEWSLEKKLDQIPGTKRIYVRWTQTLHSWGIQTQIGLSSCPRLNSEGFCLFCMLTYSPEDNPGWRTHVHKAFHSGQQLRWRLSFHSETHCSFCHSWREWWVKDKEVSWI